MFGQMGKLMQLLSNPEKLKQDVADMQQRLASARYVGEAGGGQVRATLDGKCELLELKIEPALVASNDVELLEELIGAAVRDGLQRARDGAQQEMQELAGGLNLPGLGNLFGGTP